MMHYNGYVFDAYTICAPSVVEVADVGTGQTSYTVPEDVGQFEFWINITSGQIALRQECQIVVVTNPDSAVGELKKISIAFVLRSS